MLRAATPERLSAFSDAVFAVLITVLVLDLRPPELPSFTALMSLWSTWLSYAVSYVFIAIGWANHHHLMRHATTATPRLMWVSLGLGEVGLGSETGRPETPGLVLASQRRRTGRSGGKLYRRQLNRGTKEPEIVWPITDRSS